LFFSRATSASTYWVNLGNAVDSLKNTVIPPLAAGVITGNTTVCQNDANINYSVPAISGATSYIWTLPAGASGTSSTNSISLNFGSTATSGNIKVKGHNAAGDGAESELVITVDPNCPSSTNEISVHDKIKIFPNPTSGLIDISVNGQDENNYKIEVFNSIGGIIQTTVKQKGAGSAQIDLSGYPTGIYFIRINLKNESYQSRIVKK